MNGKNITIKTPSGDFQVTTPKTPLLSQQAVTNIGISVPYTNLQLNPYLNTQLDLFCSDSSSFDTRVPSIWLTNCADPNTRLQSPTREGCWLQSCLVHLSNEDQEDAWSQNPMVHIHSNFFTRMMNKGKTLSPVTICLNNLCSMLAKLVNSLMALKTILLYVYG